MQHHNLGPLGRPAAWQGLSAMVLASQMGAKLGLQKSAVAASHFSRVAAFISDQPNRFQRALEVEDCIAAFVQSAAHQSSASKAKGNARGRRLRVVLAVRVSTS